MSEKKEIAVVGDANTAIGFKLAGLKRVYAIEDNVEDKVLTELLKELYTDRKVGIIVLTENFKNRAETVTRNDEGSPIVVVLPMLHRPKFPDARKYYREQITNILGFTIQL